MVKRSSPARAAFISYHRESSHGHAQTFYRALAQVLGERHVFMDVGRDAIPFGEDWRKTVPESLQRSDLMLLLVDPGLADRLGNPSDSVRFEVEAAIERGVRIVPVRVNGAAPFAAGALPAALEFLADANTPAVRPDSAIADVNAIVKSLTGHSPADVRVADRWDASVIAGILVVGVLAFVSFGRGVLNVRETWLWGSLLVIPMLFWWFGRRAIRFPVSSTGPSRRAYAGGRALIVLLSAGAWAFAANRLYRVPVLSGQSGILVGRFDNDPTDRFQHELTQLLHEELAQEEPIVPAMPVEELPRRIKDEDSARRYAERSGADAVLWGELDADAADPASVEATIRVVFVKRPGMFQRAAGVGRSASGQAELARPERLELNDDLAVFRDVLPGVMAGYQLYVNAGTAVEIAYTADFLGRTLSRTEDTAVGPAMEDVLAMLHFLRGNVRFLADDADSAAADYAEAIRHSTRALADGDGTPPTYVEPLNNLAYLQLDNGHIDSALTTLMRSELVCATGSRRPAACAAVAYQIAGVLSQQGDFEQAASALDDAIGGPGIETDIRLLAYAYQARAYNRVRLASIVNGDSTTDLLRFAEDDSDSAVETMGRLGEARPARWAVTVARIGIERKLWNEALDTLRWVLEQRPDDDEVKILVAAVRTCMDDLDDELIDMLQGYYMSLMMNTASPHTQLEKFLEEYRRITGECSAAGG